MTTFDYRVRIADGAGTLRDVTAYVRGWSTQRGRSRELDSFNAGTFSLSLQNYDGRFLPEGFTGATSPYGSDLAVPGRTVILDVYGASSWRGVISGTVEDASFAYDSGRIVSARVSGVDSLGNVARLSLGTEDAGWSGTDTAGNWIYLILRESGWDQNNDFVSNLTTESSDELAWSAPVGTNTLAACQAMVRSEGFARLFARRFNEDVVFQGRYATVSATSSVTFGPSGVPIQSVGLAVSSDLLFNQVVVKSTGTPTVIVDDVTSQTTFGLRSLSRTDLLFGTLAGTRAYAQAYLDVFKDPQTRLESLTVNLHALTDAQRDSVLARDMGDVVTATFTPRGADEVDLELLVEGIAHNVAPNVHEVTFQLSPRPAINRFTLDADQLDVDRIGF